ncbi:MAG: hypothetical protein Q4D56_02690, partial [Bacteroides sp.]|nr:hypothetical protein [Bacteroides sp.]
PHCMLKRNDTNQEYPLTPNPPHFRSGQLVYYFFLFSSGKDNFARFAFLISRIFTTFALLFQ